MQRKLNKTINRSARIPTRKSRIARRRALVSRDSDTFGYNARSEVVFSRGGAGNAEEDLYAYDDIGNLQLAAFNAVTNSYTANNLNQYTLVGRGIPNAPEEIAEPMYDADGNMLSDGNLTFTYDSANRLKTVSSNGVILVTNFYDAKSRRVKKVTPEATTAFFYDGWNLIEERIAYTNGTTSTIHYYWGKDLSGTLQGAGGVGGLLYLTVDGVVRVPFFDNNGNVTRYLDANGDTMAQYTYDAFGNLIAKSGPLADFFRHRFSTKYHDSETGLYYYGYRFYHPSLMRWLNRDPTEELGRFNLFGFCGNNGVCRFDKDGRAYFALRKLKGFVWLGPISHNPLFDILNIEIAHELVFLEDNGSVNDFGYSHNGVVQESPEYLKSMTYYKTDGGYNDCVMRKAIEQVPFNGHDYSVFWFAGHIMKCNCQDYCSALRRKYAELIKDKKVRCECGLK
jgi:RHS repeat-associated protein